MLLQKIYDVDLKFSYLSYLIIILVQELLYIIHIIQMILKS